MNIIQKGLRIANRKMHKNPRWLSYPEVIQLDTMNTCNAKCIYCNVQGCYNMKRGIMPLETIETVLKYWGRRDYNSIRPFMNGEPTLEVRLPEINRMIRKYCGTQQIIVYTNGAGAYPEVLFDRNIDEIRFTISAATRRTYKEVMGIDKFLEVKSIMDYIKENKYPHQRIYANFVLCKQNEYELATWKKMFDGFEQVVLPIHNAAGMVNSDECTATMESIIAWTKDRPCLCFHSLAIGWAGEIMQCTITPYSLNYGNIKDTDMQDAWQRRIKDRLTNKICSTCSYRAPFYKKVFERYGIR